jgi:hypothetical protein
MKDEKRFSAEERRDRSGNPFLPAFEAKKIVTDSPNKCSTKKQC